MIFCCFLLFLFLFSNGNAQDLGSFLGSFLQSGKLEVHGHYCGLNHGDSEYKKKPIDKVDAACFKHDQCYDKFYLDCNCDVELIDELKKLLTEKLSRKAKEAASLITSWFETSACSCKGEKEVRKQLQGNINYSAKKKCKSVLSEAEL